MNQKIIQVLSDEKKHLEYYNTMAPFPVYDTEYVNDVINLINKMENTKIDYDELPVVACKFCNSLYIENDEVENDICMRCGATNELVVYNTIHDYLKAKDDEA